MMAVAIAATMRIQVIILILLNLNQREGAKFYHFDKQGKLGDKPDFQALPQFWGGSRIHSLIHCEIGWMDKPGILGGGCGILSATRKDGPLSVLLADSPNASCPGTYVFDGTEQ